MKPKTQMSIQTFCFCILALGFCSACNRMESTINTCFEAKSASIPNLEVELDQELVERYLDYWKNYVMSRSGMDESTFDNRIRNIRPSANDWNSGVSFRVDYIYRQDWLRVHHSDEILVKVGYDASYFPQHSVPRDRFLSEDWFQYLADSQVFNSHILRLNIPRLDSIAYQHCGSAIAAFQEKTGYPQMRTDELSFYVPGKFPRIDGDIYLLGRGTLSRQDNRCLKGWLNLVSGEAEAREDVCWQ